ncbi:MAG: hypothetical protein ACYCU0_14840, partial [Solirubrobacteraceae bacterium]
MTLFQSIAIAIALVALAVRVLGRQRRLLHLFQLEHYEPARLMLWLRRRSELFDLRELIAVLALYAAAAANVAAGQHLLAGVLALLSAPIAAAGFRDWRRPAAKPLVFTARAKRLVALAVAPSALVALAAIVLVPVYAGVLGAAVALGAGWLLLALSPYVLLVANGFL